MNASLPMYDFPDCRDANDRYWALIRQGLQAKAVDAPEALTRDVPDLMAHWQRYDLVLSQTCGMPYKLALHGKVTLIGTMDYAVEGCPPGYYNSVFVARAQDMRDSVSAFRDARFAYNQAHSNSGWATAQTHAAGLGFQFRPLLETGAHALSAHAVMDGLADIAAIDAVTWRLLQRNDATMAGLRVVERTKPTPGLPYISALGANHRVMFDAIAGALTNLSASDRETLGVKRLLFIPPVAYLAVPTPALAPSVASIA